MTIRAMATHRSLIAAILITGVVVAGCGNNKAAMPAGVDRTDARAVADAFANAWAGGNLTAACSYTTERERDRLSKQSLCAGTAGWPHQTPRATQVCTFTDGYEVVYAVDQPVNRFLIFKPNLIKQSDGTWAVDTLGQASPGEGAANCQSSPPSSGTT